MHETTLTNENFFSRHGFKILIVATFLLPFAFGGARRALENTKNDVKGWLPPTFQETSDLAWFKDHFPGEEFVLVSWEGCTLDDARLELLTNKIEASINDTSTNTPALYEHVLSGPSAIRQLTEEPVELPYDQAVGRLTGSLIGQDGQQTCAVISLSKAGRANIRSTVDEIIRLVTEECAIRDEQLHLGGVAVDNYHIDREGERTLFRLAFLSGAIGLPLAWWCLRSIWLTLIVFFLSIYAAAVSLAAVFFSGGAVDAVLLTMPSLVYVLTMSSSIHMVNYFRDSLREGSPDGAAGIALKMGWAPCTLAASTTALGLASLCLSELSPIFRFGLYSSIGILLSLLMVFFVLPAMLQTFHIGQRIVHTAAEKNSAESLIDGFWERVAGFVVRRHALVTAGCLILLVGVGLGLKNVQTSIKLMKLFSPDARIIRDYTWLEQHLGELVPMEVVLRIDKEGCELNFLDRMKLVQEVQHEIESIDVIGSTLATTTFAPSLDRTPLTAEDRSSSRLRTTGDRIGSGLGSLLGRSRRARLEHDVHSRQLERHRDEFLAGDYLSEDEEMEYWRINARVGALNDVDYGQFVDQIKHRVEPILQKQRDQGVQGLDALYTGLVPLVYKSQRTLMENLIESFGTAFLLIAVVMFFVLRSISGGLISMIPNIFPAVIIFGILGWLHVEVDIGSMMCASVALGVGVDDTIHFLTWFRRGIARGLIRQDAVKLAFSRCATAMTQTTIIGGLGLSVFALSAFTPTRRFGYLMLSLLTAALVGDLLLLPALLSGPLGRVFSKRAKKSKSANEAEIETVQASPSALPENAAPHTSSALARSKRQSRRPL